jgi:hypothetical protein
VLSTADERYDFQFIVVDQCGLVERLASYNRGVTFDRDAARIKFERLQELRDRQTVIMFSPQAVNPNPHRAIMRPSPQRVKAGYRYGVCMDRAGNL